MLKVVIPQFLKIRADGFLGAIISSFTGLNVNVWDFSLCSGFAVDPDQKRNCELSFPVCVSCVSDSMASPLLETYSRS